MKDKNGAFVFGEDEATPAFNQFLEMLLNNADITALENSEVSKHLELFLSDEKHIRILEIGDQFYRARCVSHKDYEDESKGFELNGDYLCGFNEKESGAPPQKESSDGRCDIDNITVLYAANDIETACSEVRPLFKEIISVAKYTAKRRLKFFNITRNLQSEDGVVMSLLEANEAMHMQNFWETFVYTFEREFRKANYVISQNISRYINAHGFDGIIYYSAQSNGLNYAIFNPTDDSIQWLGSQLYICTHKQICFNSFNDQRPLRPVQKHIDTADVEKIKTNTIHRIIEKRGQGHSDH